jgi:Ca2+-binding EF-hand superfamily protein
MRLRSAVVLGMLSFLLLTVTERAGRAQFGGIDTRNPDGMFNWYSQVQYANEELVIEKILSRMDPELAEKLKAYAVRVGISNGKLTKAQFVEFWTKEAVPFFEARAKQRSRESRDSKEGKETPTPGEKTPGTTAEKEKQPPQPPAFQARPFNEEEARGHFKQLDRDQNGYLDISEYRQSSIRRELDRWDTNQNQLIELDEFLAYQRDRHNERELDRKAHDEEREAEKRLHEEFKAFKQSKMAAASMVPTGPILPDKSVASRPTRPDAMPSWFKELDTDMDNQVGLYEWRKADKDIDEFRKYDRNADGLITREEVIWYNKNNSRTAVVPPPPEKGKSPFTGFGKGGKDSAPTRP